MAVNVPQMSQWDLVYTSCCLLLLWFQRTRGLGLSPFCEIEYDEMQIYLAVATENQSVDTRTAASAPGGRGGESIKSLPSPPAIIHSVRWARSSYCGTNV